MLGKALREKELRAIKVIRSIAKEVDVRLVFKEIVLQKLLMKKVKVRVTL